MTSHTHKAYPNVVIAGFTKCGTSSLFDWLNAHPEVCGSTRKEVQYFMDKTSSAYRKDANYLTHGLDKYLDFFLPNYSNQKVIIEATPGYAYQTTALEAFATEPALSHTKLLFIVREPIEKLRSTYNYFSQNWASLDHNISFEMFIDMVHKKESSLSHNEYLYNAISHGEYSEYLQQWERRCGKHRIFVLSYHELKKNPKAFTMKVAGILGINPSFYEAYEFSASNVSYEVKNRWVHKIAVQVRNYLPQGKFREQIRSIYHRYNIKSKKKQKETNIAEGLKQHYMPFNQKLKTIYGIEWPSAKS